MEQQPTIAKKPVLHETHILNGAKFQETQGWLLPGYYTDAVTENLTVRSRVGITDLSYRGFIKIAGIDAASFLQGIITNDTNNLRSGDGLHAALLTVKGHVIADFILLAFEDHFLLETEGRIAEKLRTMLSRYRIREKITIEPDDNIGSIGVQGPDSPSLVAEASGNLLPELTIYHHHTTHINGEPVTVRNQSLTGERGYILTMHKASLRSVWEHLLKAGEKYGVRPIGYQAMESLRVEAGIPKYGQDLTEENIPLELEKEDMISFTKGCYVGQEVIARLKFLGQANKHLKGLLLTGSTPPAPESRIWSDEKEIGKVTSSTYSPSMNQAIAMSYIRREFSRSETIVLVELDGERVSASVADLPFISH